MTEQKEFESLDELFRKTFDNLPETPASSGWDIPSEQVWQHVQEQIKPPRSGWSTQTLMLLAAFAVVLTVGLYFLLNRPAQPEIPVAAPAPVTAETPGQAASGKPEQMNGNHTATPEETPVLPANTMEKKAAAPKKPAPNDPSMAAEAAEAAKTTQNDSSAKVQEEPERKVPNTTLRRKAELARRAEQAWKTSLQPLPQRWPGKPEK